MARAPQPLDAVDLTLAAQFAGWAMLEEVTRRLALDGFADSRYADGVLIQHLVEGSRTATELAARMGVTQQASSKAVADLERRGYVVREVDPHDARSRRIALSQRGTAVVAAARTHRAALVEELSLSLGPRRVAAARRLLLEVVEQLGAEPALRSRRVRPPA